MFQENTSNWQKRGVFTDTLKLSTFFENGCECKKNVSYFVITFITVILQVTFTTYLSENCVTKII